MLRRFDPQNRIFLGWTLSSQLFVVLSLLAVQPLFSQQPLEVEFNLFSTPSCRQTLMALNSPPPIATFEQRPLSECLKSLSEVYRVSIWIDRRVDVSRLVSIVGVGKNDSAESQTTLGRLVAVAKLGGADAGPIENVVYIGPTNQVGAVQRAAVRLHNEIMRSRNGAQNQQVELRTLSWEDITTPSELLDNIQKQWSIKVDSKLPHDLMHAGELPSSTLATQLTLLHAGFDRQIDCDNNGKFTSSQLVHDDVWKAKYGEKELQSDRLTAARKEFPKATVLTKSKVSTVTGPTAFHLRLLATRPQNARASTARNAEPKFTIPMFRAPLERVVGDLAKHLGMEVTWSKEIPESTRQTIVTFGVATAKTPDEILQQIADENKLKIQRQGQKIEVLP